MAQPQTLAIEAGKRKRPPSLEAAEILVVMGRIELPTYGL